MYNSWFNVKELADSVFMIQEPLRRLAPDYLTNTINMFVIHDKKEAMIIDCGTGIYYIQGLIMDILGKRTIISPFITHSHWDHVGGLYEFDSALIHPDESLVLQKPENLDFLREDAVERNDPVQEDMDNPFTRLSFTGEPIHVKEDEWVQIGKLEVQVIFLPGHTKGSIGLWYPDEKFLFVGDALQTGYVYADEDPKIFFKTVEKIKELEEMYYLPSHEQILLQKSDLDELLQIYTKIENNSIELMEINNRYIHKLLYKGDKFSILLPLNKS